MSFVVAAQIVFWSSAAALFYAYAGYPVFVFAVSRLFPKQIRRGEFEPKVTVLITAYNEERAIRAKLENTLEIDYPKEKLEILVASDCSTDRTDDIVREFEKHDVKLFRQPERLGKTSAQNAAVMRAGGDVILFSDATTVYAPDVLKKMLPSFADESVGCVAGRLIYTDEANSAIGAGAKNYWSYETFLKESESRACSLIGASGCLYAVRKTAYRPMRADACSDFLIATVMREQNLRTVFEPRAVCTEETNRDARKEMQMRVRVISQTISDVWRSRPMLNPLRGGFYSIELISHKIFRYAAPLFLFLLFVSSAALAAYRFAFFEATFAVQILFYAAALLAYLLERNGARLGVLSLPLYFVLANLASAVAFYKFARGERFAVWQPIRENENWKMENGEILSDNR